MSLINRLRCIARGHQFSPPEQQECWWVIECQCCGASRSADSVLEFLTRLGSVSDRGATCAVVPETLPTSSSN